MNKHNLSAKEKLLRLDNIMFRVKNLQKSKKFYQEVLGLKKAWEDKTNKMIGFILKESKSEIVIHSNSSLGKFDYSFLVKDVESFVNSFLNNGGKIKGKILDVRCGKYVVLLDLDKNKIPVIDSTKFNDQARYN